MKRQLTDFVAKLICYSGAYLFFRRLYAEKFCNPIQILFAHDILDINSPLYPFKNALGDLGVKEFEKRMIYLKKHYTFISLAQAIELLRNDPHQRVRNTLVLTFDDGYRSIYSKVFPIIKRLDIPITVFLTTGFMRSSEEIGGTRQSDNILWYDKLIQHIAMSSITEINVTEYGNNLHYLRTFEQKIDFIEWYCNYIKDMSEFEKQKSLDSLFAQLQTNGNQNIDEQGSLRNSIEMLSWHEVKEMYSSGLVDFGAHSVTHPLLSRISLAQARSEIEASKMSIEKELECRVFAFAYPNGRDQDFNENHIKILTNSGFACACTTSGYGNKDFANPMRLGRIGLDPEPWHNFVLKVCGFFELIRALKSFSKGF